jgi:2,3-bisphosphoglycerate-independent phosphoglycerate mutase
LFVDKEKILLKTNKVPTVLMVLDGWGVSTGKGRDAIAGAATPVMDRLAASYPSTALGAAGLDVGLPENQIGNSEVGHLNLGAGRVVYQDFTRINKAVETGEFFENPVLLEMFSTVKQASGRLHIMGLLSDGGVHSHIDHIKAVAAMASDNGVSSIYLHAFMDGRDTPPKSGLGYMKDMETCLAALRGARMASVAGRFYPMDRDNRWDRVERGYEALVAGRGLEAGSGEDAVRQAYERGETDEFIQPTVIFENGSPVATIGDGDGVVFMNFRGDRAREITRALNDADFGSFRRSRVAALSSYVCLAQYDESFTYPVVFPPQPLDRILGEVIADKGLTQLRIAETEKYAHVTFFFNGGEETVFPGEDRCLVPSPQDIPTYDLKPQMSAEEVTVKLEEYLEAGKHDFVLVNYANPDMVGHTGVYEAALTAVEKVDECIGRICDKVLKKSGVLLITADHGNAESMQDADGTPHTAHTTRRVPFILVGAGFKPGDPVLREGKLADVAPTILKIMGIQQPPEMTGEALF